MSLEDGATVWINIAMNKIFYVTTAFIQQDSRGKNKTTYLLLIINKIFIHAIIYYVYLSIYKYIGLHMYLHLIHKDFFCLIHSNPVAGMNWSSRWVTHKHSCCLLYTKEATQSSS